MRGLQLGAAVAVLTASLILVVASISSGRYLGAVGWLLGCLAIEACIFGISNPWGDDSWLFKLLATSAAAAGILSALTGSHATDSRRQSAQLDLMGFYIELVGGIYEGVTPAARRVAERGVVLCAVQRYVDISDLANELYKAQHLGPTSSLILGSYEQFAREDPPVANCVGSFVELNRIAPDLAKIFLRRHPEVLNY
ncbi:hypothetical protein M5J07_20780 [Achromobacter mucicolens]|uniref:hypothetical protein n=1 Tax=Achromobacter mucicolens TaxID=1389922 RepID=UPI0020A3553D|nr:hypothetical protein [Achromobacter mucicolens]MCP2517387.1 hypothetical protein [Achromobacter mucicolens]